MYVFLCDAAEYVPGEHGRGVLHIVSPGMEMRVKRECRAFFEHESVSAPWDILCPASETCPGL